MRRAVCVQLADAAPHLAWLGHAVVAGCVDGSVMLMDQGESAMLAIGESPVSALLSHRDSIVAGFFGGDVQVVRLGTARSLAHGQAVPRSLITCSAGVAWVAAGSVEIRRPDGAGASVDARIGDLRCLSRVQGGLLIAAGVGGAAWIDATIELVDEPLEAPTLISIAVDPLRRFVAGGDLAGSIHVIRVGDTSGNELSGYPDRVHLLGWLVSGRGLCASADDQLTVWAATDDGIGGSDPQLLVAHDAPITALAPHPLVDVVVTGDSVGTVQMWAPALVDEPVASVHIEGAVLAVSWHPGGRRVAVAGSDGTITVFQVCRGPAS